MQKIIVLALVLLGGTSNLAEGGTHYSDIIVLTNDMVFKGQVVKVRSCEMVFKAEGRRYSIPFTDIKTIEFLEQGSKVHKKFKSFNLSSESCAKGLEDAENFHGRRSRHFFLGLLLPAIPVVVALLSEPNPVARKRIASLSQNQNLFSDPDYLMCYKKTAKKSNVKNAAIGSGVTLVIMGVAALLLTIEEKSR